MTQPHPALLLAFHLALALILLPGPAIPQDRPPVAEALGGTVVLTPDNTLPLTSGPRRLAQIVFEDSQGPVLGPAKTAPGHQLLRRLVATGQAAGNTGDLYDNRDRNHSRLSSAAHPQLTHVLYDQTLQKQGLDYGLSQHMLFDAPVIGNSSTALTAGPAWRSQPRLALTVQSGALQHLVHSYGSGQIHVYPEHLDHDPELGDLLPANTPYMLISQGSSGSDQPHLEALAMILAAFRADTKAALRNSGLLAPTVQMIYRRARVGVRSRDAYHSGAAHPSVFRASDIDLTRMVSLANSIRPDAIPPMVRLDVLEETQAREGIDFFGEGLSEALFDTPSAISRIWRSRAGRRVMIVSAAATRDINGRDLRFHWSLLRGDPERVRITPLTPNGSHARIVMDWQAPQPAPGAPEILSHRIDIGVFAHNGIHDSAPAFVSVLLPHHETRVYEPGPGGSARPVSITRQVPDGTYADPVLFPATPWRDVYHYGPDGQPVGWTRHRGTQQTRYTAKGRRLSAGNNPAIPVQYQTATTARGARQVTETPPPSR